MLRLLTTGVISTSGIILSAVPEGATQLAWVQYGALGLCGVMVWAMIKHIQKLGCILDKKDDKLIEIVEKDIKSRNRLAEALEDRPCLMGDSRA